MGSFESIKVFALRAPAGRVHDAVTHPETWLANCGLLRELRLLRPGGPAGVGARHRAVVTVGAVYAITWELETVRSVPGRLVEWTARGDIEGCGLWELEQDGDVTQVVNTWRVRPTQPWMGLVSPFARGMVAHEHDALMREGVQELARHLSAEVVSDLSLHRGPVRGSFGRTRLAGAAEPVGRRHRQRL